MTTTPLGKPPCGSCKRCCTNFQAVALMPGDDPTQYECFLAGADTGKGVLILAFKDNGDCVYLGPDGCTIHDRAPLVCREFDCRGLVLQLTRNEKRRMIKAGNMERDVFNQGNKLLNTLSDDDKRLLLAQRRDGIGKYMLNSTNMLDKDMGKKNGIVANAVLGKIEKA